MLLQVLLIAASVGASPKALTPEMLQAYLKGEGMGFAKAAELNHYPGPRHVIDLGPELELTNEQVHRTKEIFAEMKEAAVQLGTEIVAQEKKLDELFRTGTIDEDELARATIEIARLQGELRAVHLRAHLRTTALLTRKQIQKYDQLRGYGQEHSGEHH